MKQQFKFISRLASALAAVGAVALVSSAYSQTLMDEHPGADNPHLRPQPKASASAAAPAKLSQADQKFISQVAASGVQEVQDGQVAQQKGNASTKNIASRIVSDRSRSNKELLDLAKKKGLGLSTDKIKPRNMGSSSFDKQYVYTVTHDYEEDISLFKKAASSSTDKDIKGWASKTLPMMQQHLSMLKSAKGGGEAKAKE